MKNQRKRFWIDPRRQGQFIWNLVLISLISGGLTLISLYITVWFNFRVLESVGLRSIPEVRAIFWTATWQLTGAFLIFQISVTSLIWFIGKRISHRLTGPLFALNRQLMQFKSGDLETKFRIRKSDYLHGLKQVFETFGLHISHVEQTQVQDLESLKKMVDQIQNEHLRTQFKKELGVSDHEEAA
jgi:hypothetical protein